MEWISVEDRLPDEAGEYLVTYHPCYWDNVRKDQLLVGLDSFRGKTTWAKKKYQVVVAWMHKPEPYIEDFGALDTMYSEDELRSIR